MISYFFLHFTSSFACQPIEPGLRKEFCCSEFFSKNRRKLAQRAKSKNRSNYSSIEAHWMVNLAADGSIREIFFCIDESRDRNVERENPKNRFISISGAFCINSRHLRRGRDLHSVLESWSSPENYFPIRLFPICIHERALWPIIAMKQFGFHFLSRQSSLGDSEWVVKSARIKRTEEFLRRA